MNINIELAIDANKKGICSEWFSRLQNTEDKNDLIKMYLEGIDFCLSKDFPSNEFIKKNFVGTCEAYGVLLDSNIDVANYKHVVALGATTGIVRYDGFAVGQVFVKHTSELTIDASGNSFIVIDVFDGAKVAVVARDNAKICINSYGGTIDTSEQGNAKIKVVDKGKTTY